MASPAVSNSQQPSNLASSIDLASKTQAKFTSSWAATITLHIVGAGFDTLGYTLSCALMSIATMPNCQTELHHELDEAKATNALHDAPLYQEAAKLPYLNACINESLRLNPVIGMTLPRTVPPGGMMIGDQHVPGGTTVGVNPRVVHRNKDVFGEDANSFNPARYLDASPDQLHAMTAVNLAFGGPSRSCPGQYLAKVALWKIVATIFLHFEIKILDDKEAREYGGGRKEESFFVVKMYGIWMRLRSRT